MEYVYNKTTLVPENVNRDTYDEVAADFLKHYGFEECLITPMPVPIFEIARKRMNLTVYTTQQLSKNCDVLGTIAFADGDVEVYDPGAKDSFAFAVERGTVLIDCTINHEGRENNTMAHECVHWHIHRYYFDKLKKQTVNSDIAFRCPVRISDSDASTRDEERMEKQARAIAPRILMPKEAAKKKIRELLVAYSYDADSPKRTAILTAVVDELASFFCVSKQSAKYRMIDLGFLNREDASEIYNFGNDNTAVFDFAESPLTVPTSNHHLTRHISLKHAFFEFGRNAAFREILGSGRFRFAENAFVINDPKYVYQDDKGTFKLTDFAIGHQDECTLVFEYALSPSFNLAADELMHSGEIMLKTVTQYQFLQRIETNYKKLPRYTTNVLNDKTFDVAKALSVVKEDFGKYAAVRKATNPITDFWERVEQIKAAKGMRNSHLKDRSGLDDATLSRIKLKKTTVTLRVGVALCFGLDLDLEESQKLLSLANLTLNDNPQCLAYKFVIENFRDCPLFEENEVLANLGAEPIGVQSKDDE